MILPDERCAESRDGMQLGEIREVLVEDREIDIEQVIRSGRNAVIDSAVDINNGIDVVAIQNPLQVEAPGPLATSRWGYGILASSAKTPWGYFCNE